MIDDIIRGFEYLGNTISDFFTWLGSIIGLATNFIKDVLVSLTEIVYQAILDMLLYFWDDFLYPKWVEWSDFVKDKLNELVLSDKLPFVSDGLTMLDSVLDLPAVIVAMVASFTVLSSIATLKFIIKLIPTIG